MLLTSAVGVLFPVEKGAEVPGQFNPTKDNQKTVEIEEGDYTSYDYDLKEGDQLTFSFDVKSGPRIDMFFFTADEYERFTTNRSFEYIENKSLIETEGGQKSYEAKEDEKVYIVLDATKAGSKFGISSEDDEELSEVKYSAVIMNEEDFERLSNMCCWGGCLFVILGMGVSIFVIYMLHKDKKREGKKRYQRTLAQLSYSGDRKICPQCQKETLWFDDAGQARCDNCGYFWDGERL